MKFNQHKNNLYKNKQNKNKLIAGDSRLKVDKKGGMVMSWKIGDKEIIPTFHKKENSESYRGGVPICFPFFGPSPEGMENIPQHGWLRNQKLQVGEVLENKVSFFGKNEPTEQYPWKLKYIVTHKLGEKSLENIVEVERLDDEAEDNAPLNPALHPYFAIKNDEQTKIDGQEPSFSSEDYGIDITDDSKIFISTQAGLVRMKTKGFNKVWIWSDAPDKYGCIEPVVQAPQKFNTTEGKFLGQKEKIIFKITLSLVKKA